MKIGDKVVVAKDYADCYTMPELREWHGIVSGVTDEHGWMPVIWYKQDGRVSSQCFRADCVELVFESDNQAQRRPQGQLLTGGEKVTKKKVDKSGYDDVLFIRGISAELKKRFKAHCAEKGSSMTREIEEFMRQSTGHKEKATR